MNKKFYITNKYNSIDTDLYNDYQSCSLDDIDDSEAKELFLDNYLEYVGIDNLASTIEKAVKKLRINGKIKIFGCDAYSIAKKYVAQRLSVEEYNVALHGTSDKPKISSLSLHELNGLLEKIDGLSIITKSLELDTYIFEAKRT